MVNGEPSALRVLRLSKSGVVSAWRERERQLRAKGADLTLVTAVRWEEGGSMVTFTDAGDRFVVPVTTYGRHPNLFVYDPRALWRTLGSARWDLIDMHEEPFGLAVAEVLVLCRLRSLRIPFVVSSAQNLDKRYPPPFRWFERRCLRRAAGAYTCNVEAGEILRRKGFRGRLVLLPLGVDVERFEAVGRQPPSGTLRVGFVGRLIPHKGVDVLLGAVVHDDRMRVEIFGAGPELESLTGSVARLGIADRVTFHGHVEEEDIPGIYRHFDVLAVPSVPMPGWIEQFGRVVVEAQAAGIPVVASASGALPDVVGDRGLLVPPGDPGALHAALSRFLDEPGLWGVLRAAGISGADRFSWESVADTQMKLYRSLAGPGGDEAVNRPPRPAGPDRAGPGRAGRPRRRPPGTGPRAGRRARPV
jgi:glycosyltransferase involved in cell wall biosynthesis